MRTINPATRRETLPLSSSRPSTTASEGPRFSVDIGAATPEPQGVPEAPAPKVLPRKSRPKLAQPDLAAAAALQTLLGPSLADRAKQSVGAEAALRLKSHDSAPVAQESTTPEEPASLDEPKPEAREQPHRGDSPAQKASDAPDAPTPTPSTKPVEAAKENAPEGHAKAPEAPTKDGSPAHAEQPRAGMAEAVPEAAAAAPVVPVVSVGVSAGPNTPTPEPREGTAAVGAVAAGPNARRLLDRLGQSRGAAPPEPPPVVRQLSRAVLLAARPGDREITLRLLPRNLGRVTVRIAVKDGRVSAWMRPENEAARGLLDSARQDLRAALEARGLRVERVEVDPTGSGAAQGEQASWGGSREQGSGDSGDSRQRGGPPGAMEASDVVLAVPGLDGLGGVAGEAGLPVALDTLA